MTREVRGERRPVLGRLCDASAYLASCFHGLQVERFCLFCLDARGRLKEQVLLQTGTADTALFDLRGLLAEAVRTRADAVLVSHNHPGLTPRPSEDDIRSTEDAIRALTAVGIPLLDHVVVSGHQAVSMRDNGFIPTSLWLNQHPNHPLLVNWLGDGT